MSNDMSQATTPSTPTTPGTVGKKRKQLGWAPPTLFIPPQEVYVPTSPHSANLSMHSSMSNNPVPPHMYHHRASEFMFNQFSGIKDFTMSTAKSGLGIGEKSAFWLYNKLSSWSKKWFTHIFLTFVIVGYTVGGALMFQTIEGRNEDKIVEVDIRAKRQALIEELRNLSIYIPQERSVGEWHGVATAKLQSFEDHVIEAYKNHQLIVANHGPKIWTFWNAVVFCSTIYTTIVRPLPPCSLECPKTKEKAKVPETRRWTESTRHLTTLRASLSKQKILPPAESMDTAHGAKTNAKKFVNTLIRHTQRVDEIVAKSTKVPSNIPVYPKLRLTRFTDKLEKKVPIPIHVTMVTFPAPNYQYSYDN